MLPVSTIHTVSRKEFSLRVLQFHNPPQSIALLCYIILLLWPKQKYLFFAVYLQEFTHINFCFYIWQTCVCWLDFPMQLSMPFWKKKPLHCVLLLHLPSLHKSARTSNFFHQIKKMLWIFELRWKCVMQVRIYLLLVVETAFLLILDIFECPLKSSKLWMEIFQNIMVQVGF